MSSLWTRINRFFRSGKRHRHRAVRRPVLESLSSRIPFDASGLVFETTAEGEGTGEAPEFSLPDVNPNSPRSGQRVSPHDYDGRVTAWYFTHST
jgi:hypothetical protein